MLGIRACFGVLGVLALSACGGEGGADDTSLGDATTPVLGADAMVPASAAGRNDAAAAVDAQGLLDAVVSFDANLSPDAAVLSDASQRDATAMPDGSGSGDAASDAASAGDASSSTDAVVSDASKPDASTPSGVCGGSTPHGCWPAKAGNPMGCPAQMPEQSDFYPPLEEWKGCASPFYEACIYLRPDGSEGNCSCDLGLHWLCTY
jgi:hypothetical protein